MVSDETNSEIMKGKLREPKRNTTSETHPERDAGSNTRKQH